MSEYVMVFFIVLGLFIVLVGSIMLIKIDVDGRSECIAQYEICVETNEGWMPYEYEKD